MFGMNSVVVRKVPSSTNSLFNHRHSKHVVNSAVVAIRIGLRRFVIRPNCMQIIELAVSEYKVNAYLVLTASFICIERENDFMPVLLKSLNELDDIAYKLSPNIWFGNTRCK
jgi:hypothetical protein